MILGARCQGFNPNSHSLAACYWASHFTSVNPQFPPALWNGVIIALTSLGVWWGLSGLMSVKLSECIFHRSQCYINVCWAKYTTTSHTCLIYTLFFLPLASNTTEMAVNIIPKISWADVPTLKAYKTIGAPPNLLDSVLGMISEATKAPQSTLLLSSGSLSLPWWQWWSHLHSHLAPPLSPYLKTNVFSHQFGDLNSSWQQAWSGKQWFRVRVNDQEFLYHKCSEGSWSLAWPSQVAHLCSSHFLVQVSPQSQILKLELFRVFLFISLFLHPALSPGLSSCLLI